MKNVCILGVCGTFMAGVASIAKELGFNVIGIDSDAYPPMSTQLQEKGITVHIGYHIEHIKNLVDTEFIVGNVASRGNPILEHLLNNRVELTSGPRWLYKNCLKDKWVLAVAGTHGKTTTSSMLAWILEYAGLNPGFLIGGIPENFNTSSRLGGSNYFVIEADEYDSAFFDKRSKFIHYNPRTLILNNLEFDHADIFRDMYEIKKQFNHLLRIMSSKSKIIYNANDENIEDLLNLGAWCDIEAVGSKNSAWFLDYNINVWYKSIDFGRLHLNLLGKHNLENALHAIAAAKHVGVDVDVSIEALSKFEGVKRRLELKEVINEVEIYEDFAHHPTAIKQTIQGIRGHKTGKIVVVVDINSNTMRLGSHESKLADSCMEADLVYWCHTKPTNWDIAKEFENVRNKGGYFAEDLVSLVKHLVPNLSPKDTLIVMSNGASNRILEKIILRLKEQMNILTTNSA